MPHSIWQILISIPRAVAKGFKEHHTTGKQIVLEKLAGRDLLMFSLLPEAETKLFAGMFAFGRF